MTATAGARALAWGRLLRLALLPTALADVAAGIVLAAGVWPAGGAPLALLLASACVYHGALALNDWADRAGDARTRPERPIPCGAISPRAALAAALGLLAAGVATAFGAAAAAGTAPALLGAVSLSTAALLALAYDLGPRGPRLGPALIAGCRAANLGAGILFGAGAAASPRPPAELAALGVAAAGAYGVYLFHVSRLGRLEDAEDLGEVGLGTRPSVHLRRAAAGLVVAGSLALLVRAATGAAPRALDLLPLVVALAGAAGLVRLSLRRTWSTGDVVRAMGASLRRLLVCAACFATLAGTGTGVVVAAVVLGGYPLSYGLRRAFPPS